MTHQTTATAGRAGHLHPPVWCPEMKEALEGVLMPDEIVLAAGTRFVETAEIPSLIVQALHPEVRDETRQVALLTKTAKPGAVGETADWDGRPINDADHKILQDIWWNLPPLRLPISEEDWRPYVDAFAAGGKDLDWELTWYCSSPAERPDVKRYMDERQHGDRLHSEFRHGRLQVLDPDTRLPGADLVYSIVTVKELTRYVSAFDISVRVESDSEEPPPAPTPGESHEDDTREDGEPYLRKGRNSRSHIEAWVKWQAQTEREQGDIGDALV